MTDPGPIATAPLDSYKMAAWEKLLIGFVFVLILVVPVIVSFTYRPKAPTCPQGYALAGGGWAGHLHCVPGVEVEWVDAR